MRVRHFNTDLKGGAATSARRLHHSLLAQNVDSIFHYHPDHHDDVATSQDSETFQSLIPVRRTGIDGLFRKRRDQQRRRDYRRYFANRPSDREIFSVPWQVKQTPFGKDRPSDIVHLHWVSSWLDLKSFMGSFPLKQPFVFSLHDMNAITGGCHHADECENFKSACKSCPQIDNPGPNDLGYRSFVYKRDLYSKQNVHIVTPSRWMENNVRSSALGKFVASVQTIRNPLDLTQFQPLEKDEARGSFSIPLNRPVIGFGAGSLSNNRKGFQDLLNALQLIVNELPGTELTVLTFGVDDVQIPAISGIEFISLGFLPEPSQQQLAYSAMDLFVLPSWAETISQTGVEAMACSTPVIAYEIGGVPEFVIPGQTGLLAKHRDPVDLAIKIRTAIKDLELTKEWGENGRKFVGEKFSVGVSCQQHLELYRSIV